MRTLLVFGGFCILDSLLFLLSSSEALKPLAVWLIGINFTAAIFSVNFTLFGAQLSMGDILTWLVTLFSSRAGAKENLQDFDGAVGDYTLAIAISPKDDTLFSKRASVKVNLKDYCGAHADYTRALGLAPGEITHHLNRSRVRTQIGDYAGAIQDAERAIAVNDKDSRGYFQRGLARLLAGNRVAWCMDAYKEAQLRGTAVVRPDDPNFAKFCASTEAREAADALLELRRPIPPHQSCPR